MKIKYSVKHGYPSVILTEEVIKTMMKFQQNNSKATEAGGQLFAIFNGSDAVVTEATKPSILDKRDRHNFQPNLWLQRRQIQARYKKGLHFVGDWHTHCERNPTPSHEDISSMKDSYCRSKHDLQGFLIVIVGTDPPPEGLFVAIVNQSITHALKPEVL